MLKRTEAHDGVPDAHAARGADGQRVAYLLHRFPLATDTFIRREIRSLEAAGTRVDVISVWRPKGGATTQALLDEWAGDATYLLPSTLLATLAVPLAIASSAIAAPRRFLSAARLAFSTARPGVRGRMLQMFYFAEAVLAARAIRGSGAQHIHNHFGDHSGTVTMLAAALTGTGYSISIHGPHIFLDPDPGLKEKVRRARFVRCISCYCRSQILALCGDVGTVPLEVVHCGLDLGRYPFRLPRKDARTIFCAARLAPEKGITFLIDAVAILNAQGRDVSVRLAGDGPSRGTIADAAQARGLADRVSLLGNLSEAEVARELAAADIFVLPSLAEGLPVSLMEAMATGVPVVATNIAGTSELVESGRNGVLVRPTDATALADAIARLIDDHAFRVSAAELARAKVEQEFDVHREAARLNACFARCLSV